MVFGKDPYTNIEDYDDYWTKKQPVEPKPPAVTEGAQLPSGAVWTAADIEVREKEFARLMQAEEDGKATTVRIIDSTKHLEVLVVRFEEHKRELDKKPVSDQDWEVIKPYYNALYEFGPQLAAGIRSLLEQVAMLELRLNMNRAEIAHMERELQARAEED